MGLLSWICGKFRNDKYQYRSLILREAGTPEQNTKRLLESVAHDFQMIRARKNREHLFIGRFFSSALMIERKLANLLRRFDPEIDSRTFGLKMKVYKDFLVALNKSHDIDWIDINEYRQLLGPLNEIKRIRDRMAHDLSYIWFTLDDLKQTAAYVKSKRSDLYESAFMVRPKSYHAQAMIASFGFVFSVKLAHIDHLFESAA
jgi:hypothetical protein